LFVSEYNVGSVMYFLQETLLVHKDLNKTEGLDDLLVELEKEGLNSKYYYCLSFIYLTKGG